MVDKYYGFDAINTGKTMGLRDFSIHDWLGPAARTLPTTDLYILNACRPWLDQPPFKAGAIRRVGANSFICGDAIIVSRRDSNSVVQKLLRRTDKRLYYIIDDNLWAADDDISLPDDYRRRLIALREGQHRLLCERAHTIVVSSKVIEEIYRDRGHQVVQLDPYWSEPFADHSHFETLRDGAPVEIGYLGSGTHMADRAFVVQVFEELLAKGLNCRLTMIGTKGVPDSLATHPRFRSLSNLPWSRYRKRLTKLRFHLLLYPMIPSAFNQSRSINKVIEHAVVGGIGIYSDTWTHAREVEKNSAGYLVNNDATNWSKAISTFAGSDQIVSVSAMRDFIYEANQTSLMTQLGFWKTTLETL